jgi:2',3'-cyclic-nucleotide 2'-phosphodiesterase (5'-nucleotidase family)
VEPGEEFLCTLNGDFLSPSLLSSLDLGAAAVSAMNAIPVTHACLGNHEFDHSIEVLGQRLAELDCAVVNTNVSLFLFPYFYLLRTGNSTDVVFCLGVRVSAG